MLSYNMLRKEDSFLTYQLFVLVSNGMLHTIQRRLRKKVRGCDVMKMLMKLKVDMQVVGEGDEHAAVWTPCQRDDYSPTYLCLSSSDGHVWIRRKIFEV